MKRLDEIEARANAATDVPALLVALLAVLEVLEVHTPRMFYAQGDSGPHCGECDTPYPCPTVIAIRQYIGEKT